MKCSIAVGPFGFYYANNWLYVLFAAIGSWLGAYASMTYLHGGPCALSAPRALTSPDP